MFCKRFIFHPSSVSLSSHLLLSLLLCSLTFAACDSGDIVEKATTDELNGHTVKLSVSVAGMSDLNEKYSLALATFKSGDNYALTAYGIPATTKDHELVSVVAPNIDGDVSTVELAVINLLRQRIMTLASINMDDYADATDTIRLDAGAVNVAMFNLIQQRIFNMSCIQCHGGHGGSGAANLNLTEGKAYDNLVDVPSTRKEGRFRVVSGTASQSLLHQILAEGGEDILHYNHTEVLSSQFKNDVGPVRTFIDDWINSLQ